MSAVAATRRGTGDARTGGGLRAFGAAVRAEWTKLLTVRSTFWALLTGLALSIGLTAALATTVVAGEPQLSAEGRARFDPAAYGLVGLNLGMVSFGVLGVLSITGEYASGMISASLAATPRRGRLLAAKAVVLALVVLVTGELAAFSSFLAGQAVYGSRGLDASLAEPAMLRAVVGGGIYLTLIALFALGVGTLLRGTAGSVTTVLGVLFLLPIAGTLLPGAAGKAVYKLLPANAGGAILNTRTTDAALPPWTGIAVFALYTALTLAAAFLAFGRRDA